MSKVTPEMIREIAQKSCNRKSSKKGFYALMMTHDLDELEEDIDAAIEVNKHLPDCINAVNCFSSGDIYGNFQFSGKFTNKKGKEVNVYINVNRSDIKLEMNPEHFTEFLKLCATSLKSSE